MSLDFKQCLFPPAYGDTLQEKVNSLVEGLVYATGIAGSHDCPTGDFEVATELVKLIPELLAKVAHGEPGHRRWLEQAIEAHFTGQPMPEYVAK